MYKISFFKLPTKTKPLFFIVSPQNNPSLYTGNSPLVAFLDTYFIIKHAPLPIWTLKITIILVIPKPQRLYYIIQQASLFNGQLTLNREAC